MRCLINGSEHLNPDLCSSDSFDMLFDYLKFGLLQGGIFSNGDINTP